MNTLRPLCVDLDGTLIQEHSLWYTKGFFSLDAWLKGLQTFSWSRFKWSIGSYDFLHPQKLSFRWEVLHYIKHHREQGGSCFLVTGSPWVLAQHFLFLPETFFSPQEISSMLFPLRPLTSQVVQEKFFSWIHQLHREENLPPWPQGEKNQDFLLPQQSLFTGLMASSPFINLVGKRKAQCLEDIFGYQQFDYIGNSPQDLWIWEKAYKSYGVGPKALALKKKLKKKNITLNIL